MGLKSLFKISTRQLPWMRLSSSSDISADSNDPLIDPEKQEYTDHTPPSPGFASRRQNSLKDRRSLCSQCIHLLVWSFVTGALIWAAGALFYSTHKFEIHLLFVDYKDGESQVVHLFAQPTEPAAVFFADQDLENRWTVSIPKDKEFPLAPQKLIDICNQARSVHHQLHMEDEHIGHPSYYTPDPDYMQVSEAISTGTLPESFPPHINSIVSGFTNSTLDESNDADPSTGICKRSLTYSLQSTDPGLGPTLMSLWLAYGLAKHEKRAFFIDDRLWAYGSWSTYFTPPPAPSCKPSPEVERVPCPHQADHLLVSTATSSWIFGHSFEEEFEDAHKMEVERQVKIFDMIREGYEALFHLAGDDGLFVESRIEELKRAVTPGLTVGLHIRHGDKHPYTQASNQSYIPVEQYVSAANKELFRSFKVSGEESEKRISKSKMLLASDDPAVYNLWEEGDATRAQDRITLSTPSVSTISGSEATLPLPFEGGFFASRFSQIKESTSWFGLDPASEYKALLARAYLLDLAVLGASDRIVCTVSSVGCRLLAVMMGWENAMERGRWINVDGDWDWQGVRW